MSKFVNLFVIVIFSRAGNLQSMPDASAACYYILLVKKPMAALASGRSVNNVFFRENASLPVRAGGC